MLIPYEVWVAINELLLVEARTHHRVVMSSARGAGSPRASRQAQTTLNGLLESAVAIAGTCRLARSAARGPELAHLWACLSRLCVPRPLFARLHLGMRLRCARYARMLRDRRCGQCGVGETRVLPYPGLNQRRLCAPCRARWLVPLWRVAPYLGPTRWLPPVVCGPGGPSVMLDALLLALD